ncbi:hypothetical protein LL037_21065 [Clostridium estertheticum]|uniref:hypothetical protein n=1 Tax=Clostridium estertheticum TaxID=238834 RepID=UPI001C0D0B9B|nr:hypothetical protein [Clostridium estertheticum]MBU3200611.1 hypothetical protein [Clostridium estertheticum]MCB2354373.1 hypothetical protein [Clostridium estertheticum]WAG42508.1 hypothetical protein LL065_07500 [Clostridium estertheticum]WAG64928.1 hypothetical protein LL037_21065 [Clostridium estertheticum]
MSIIGELKLGNIYVSECKGREMIISNNRLVYLLERLFNMVIKEAYDDKWDSEESYIKD